MKNTKVILRLMFLCCFLFITSPPPVEAQELECTAPPGYVCGTKEGNKYKFRWIYIVALGAYVPVVVTTKCCVDSVQSNACNAIAVGCSSKSQK